MSDSSGPYARHLAVADQLLALETEMRRLGLWATTPPPESALESEEPFCRDSLDLPQWLQFVFVPRMAELVEAGGELPDVCAIRPVAEYDLRPQHDDVRALLYLLGEIDDLLSGDAAS